MNHPCRHREGFLRNPAVPVALAAMVAIVIATALGEDGPAAEGGPQDVGPLLAAIVKEYDMPGMAAVALTSDGLVGRGAAGVRRRGGPEPITPDDRFHLGSCTKAMTATLAAVLVKEGKLAWDSTPEDVFPDLADAMDPAFRKVTLEQLLGHRAGTTGKLPGSMLWLRLRAHFGKPFAARRILLRSVLAGEPEVEPGTKFVYSNAGYAIAGHMAEAAAGKPWEELLGERLGKPLGMTSLGFGPPGTKEVVDQPRGHTPPGMAVEPGHFADNPAAIGPAGTVHCTLDDWARFATAHLAAAQGKPTALGLPPAAWQKLHTPAPGEPPAYALGWGVVERDWAQGTALTHSGSNLLWYAVAWLAPKRDFAVLVACNQGGEKAFRACDAAAAKLIDRFLEKTPPAAD